MPAGGLDARLGAAPPGDDPAVFPGAGAWTRIGRLGWAFVVLNFVAAAAFSLVIATGTSSLNRIAAASEHQQSAIVAAQGGIADATFALTTVQAFETEAAAGDDWALASWETSVQDLMSDLDALRSNIDFDDEIAARVDSLVDTVGTYRDTALPLLAGLRANSPVRAETVVAVMAPARPLLREASFWLAQISDHLAELSVSTQAATHSERNDVTRRLVLVGVAAGLQVLIVAAAIGVVRSRALRRRSHDLEVLVARRTTELEAAKRVAEEASASKSRLMSAVSHDLRQPLTSIVGFTELLQAESLTGPQSRWSAAAHVAAQQLTHLVDQVAEMSSYDGRELRLNIADFDPRQLVASITTSLSAVESTDQVVGVVDECLAASYRSDEPRLRRVLLNLVTNARKYGAEPITLAVTLVRSASDAVDVVRFSVTDHGPGIPAETLDSLFEPFVRGHVDPGGGLGLGLTISHRIVERLGGELGVSTRPEFTEFSFEVELPIGGLRDHPVRWRPLIIEDDPAVRQMFEDELAVLGVTGSVVADGASAIAELARMPFNCVLTDHRLASELGSDVARRVRDHPAGVDLPVIAVTGNPSEAVACGAYDDVIAKPIAISQLVDIAEACHRHGVSTGGPAGGRSTAVEESSAAITAPSGWHRGARRRPPGRR